MAPDPVEEASGSELAFLEPLNLNFFHTYLGTSARQFSYDVVDMIKVERKNSLQRGKYIFF